MYSHEHKEKCTNWKGEEFVTGTGLKLMEHSWLGNTFVGSFASLLTPRGKFYKQRVVWAGDYADGEPNLHDYYRHRLHDGEDGGYNERAVECEGCANLYHLCLEELKLKPRKPVSFDLYPFIVNYDQYLFVDTRKVPRGNDPEWDTPIHPLPLLTCEGNNRGGGDFRGDERDLVGVWARDHIGIEKKVPKGSFTELIFDLVE